MHPTATNMKKWSANRVQNIGENRFPECTGSGLRRGQRVQSLCQPPLTVTSTCFDVYFWKEEPPPPAAYSKVRILQLSSCPIFESTFAGLRFPAIFAGSGPGTLWTQGTSQMRQSGYSTHRKILHLFPSDFFSRDKQTKKNALVAKLCWTFALQIEGGAIFFFTGGGTARGDVVIFFLCY